MAELVRGLVVGSAITALVFAAYGDFGGVGVLGFQAIWAGLTLRRLRSERAKRTPAPWEL